MTFLKKVIILRYVYLTLKQKLIKVKTYQYEHHIMLIILIYFNDTEGACDYNTCTTNWFPLTDNRDILFSHMGLEPLRERIHQGLLGWPEKSYLKTYVNNNILLNWNINVDDINRAEHIYREAKPILWGKTRRKKPTLH